MAGVERPYPPIDPPRPGDGGGSGEAVGASGSPVRWDEDGDGMATVAKLDASKIEDFRTSKGLRCLRNLSTLRSWLNFPWAHTMEYKIYKAANSLCSYCKVELKPEKAIPDTILKQAKVLAVITVVKIGMMVTYKVGTGLVVARRADGSWSPPSAISTCGIGYGAQVGGELADFIIVLRNTDAISTFSGKSHLSVLVLVLLLAMSDE